MYYGLFLCSDKFICPTNIYDTQELCQRAIIEYNWDHPHSNLNMLSPYEFTQLVKEGRVKVTNQQTIEILTHAA